jgi:DDE superfamily endonuclease
MLTPSPEILPCLATFAPAMTAPTFIHFCTLCCGALLAPGRRTVAAALRVLGLQASHFSKYHRVFNSARWSALLLSRLLLCLLIEWFVPPGSPLQILVDETLERRRSRQLRYRGLFRDPVRSTAEHVQFSWGVRWLCFALLVKVPWSTRQWALPFLVFPLLSEKSCQRLGKRHRTLTEWTALLLAHIARWVPQRAIVLVGDGSYAAVPLAEACLAVSQPVRLVSRLRLDARLYDFPEPPPAGKRGPKPKKGKRQVSLAARLADPATCFKRVQLRWYGAQEKALEVATGVSLWYRPKHRPLPIRWVLVRTPAGDQHPIEPGACFCTDPEATPEQVLQWFVGRWNIEVTFAELRAHLGFETQRHWSPRAAGRVIPCLCALFSLAVVRAKALHPQCLPISQSRWYHKADATFADALAAVRRDLWRGLNPEWERTANYVPSVQHEDVRLIPDALWRQIEHVICYAAR